MVRRCGALDATPWPDAAAAVHGHDGTRAGALQRAARPGALVQRCEASDATPWPGAVAEEPNGMQVPLAVP